MWSQHRAPTEPLSVAVPARRVSVPFFPGYENPLQEGAPNNGSQDQETASFGRRPIGRLERDNNVRRYAARSLAISESLLGDRLSKMQRAGVKVPRSGWRPQKRGPEFRGQGPESGQRRAESRGPQAVAVTVGHSPCSAVRSPLSARLADILAFNSKLAGHPLVDAVEESQRRQADGRRIEIHEACGGPANWWTSAPRKCRPESFGKASRSTSTSSSLAATSSGSSRWACVHARSAGRPSPTWSTVKVRRRQSHSVQPVPNPQSLPGRSGATTKD